MLLPERSLRSSVRNLLAVPKTLPKTKGDQAFSVRAPQLWKSLPEDLRLAQSVTFEEFPYSYCFKMAFL